MNTVVPKPGQRVECVLMLDEHDPVPPGARGTVTHVDKWGASNNSANVHVAWDNGRTLALLTDVDQWKVLGCE